MEHLQEEQLTLHYYGEAGDRSQVEDHLESCAECRAQYQALQRVLNSVDAFPVPERGEDYPAQVWSRIEAQLPKQRWYQRWRKWVSVPKWAPAAAVCALIIAAFGAGWYTHRAQTKTVAGAQGQVRERVLLVAVGDHLERSQMVLIELANATANREVDLSGEKMLAENLVDSNRLFRQTAVAAGESGVASVLDDLERVLLDVAHSPDTVSGDELQSLQKRIEEQGLLFKVRVVSSQIRERNYEPAKRAGATKL